MGEVNIPRADCVRIASVIRKCPKVIDSGSGKQMSSPLSSCLLSLSLVLPFLEYIRPGGNR